MSGYPRTRVLSSLVDFLAAGRGSVVPRYLKVTHVDVHWNVVLLSIIGLLGARAPADVYVTIGARVVDGARGDRLGVGLLDDLRRRGCLT